MRSRIGDQGYLGFLKPWWSRGTQLPEGVTQMHIHEPRLIQGPCDVSPIPALYCTHSVPRP